jgi:hypothetical protein
MLHSKDWQAKGNIFKLIRIKIDWEKTVSPSTIKRLPANRETI